MIIQSKMKFMMFMVWIMAIYSSENITGSELNRQDTTIHSVEGEVVHNYLDELYTHIVQGGKYTFEEMQSMMKEKNQYGWVCINDERLNDEDAKNISIILEQNPNIKRLYLSGNEITDKGLGCLLNFLIDILNLYQ
jgi:hypothetical protein